MTASCSAICAICYEDARPLSDDLVSITLCGHVFHDICLQQWLEYTPRGRKATCPLCKRECGNGETHRLYFQSAADTAKGRSPPRTSARIPSDSGRPPVDEALVIKLEGQLSTTKAALLSYQEQVKDLDSQLSEYILRVDKAESARTEAHRERAQCRDAFSRAQEELKRSMMERSMLLEKNISMAKELAAHKLIGDTDLAEEDVLRLASVGRSSNKDDIIDTLTKSLILRNKTYKDLMARCNELGMSESRAVRGCERAVELSKKLKAKVQELERKLEDQDNARLQSLLKDANISSGDCPSSHVARKRDPTSAASCRERLTEIRKLSACLTSVLSDQEASASLTGGESVTTRDVSSSTSAARETGHQKLHAVDVRIQSAPQATISEVSGQMDRRKDSATPLIERGEQRFHLDNRSRFSPVSKVGIEDSVTSNSRSLRTEKTGAEIPYCVTQVNVESQSSTGKAGNMLELRKCVTWAPRSHIGLTSGEQSGSAFDHCPMIVEGEETPAFVLPIRRELSFSEGSSPRLPFPASNPGGRLSHAGAEAGGTGPAGSNFRSMCRIVHNDDTTPSIPLDARKLFSSGLNSLFQGSGAPSGKYISTGNDGRGGRVTVLRPSHAVNSQGLVSTPSKPARLKRSKLTDAGASNKVGNLRMEHFFERVATA